MRLGKRAATTQDKAAASAATLKADQPVVTPHPKTDKPVLGFGELDVKFATEFGAVHAVRGVSIDVRPGEVVGLVGESGSGKSVTSTTALGLLPSNAVISGSVQVAGREVRGMTSRGMRALRGAEVGMVFQEPMTALNPVLTIGRQMTEGLETHGLSLIHI